MRDDGPDAGANSCAARIGGFLHDVIDLCHAWRRFADDELPADGGGLAAARGAELEGAELTGGDAALGRRAVTEAAAFAGHEVQRARRQVAARTQQRTIDLAGKFELAAADRKSIDERLHRLVGDGGGL